MRWHYAKALELRASLVIWLTEIRTLASNDALNWLLEKPRHKRHKRRPRLGEELHSRLRVREFLEARIVPQRIEYRIEPEQRGSRDSLISFSLGLKIRVCRRECCAQD
jgi:hypothetical protein